MQTQRDHVHAHQFQMGRMSSALVLGDPASDEIPSRRSLIGLLVGALVGTLTLVGFGVYGWLVPGGNTAWQAAGVVIVEKQTGDRFLFLGGVLRPVPNLTSARLVLGGPGTVKLVSRESLAGVPRGAAIGMADVPQSPPAAADLVSGPWLACLTGPDPAAASSEPGGSPEPGTSPQVAAPAPYRVGFDPDVVVAALPEDRFVLAAQGDQRWLLRAGARHRIGGDTAAAALGLTAERPVPVTADWLSALPEGPPIAAADLDGLGGTGPQIGGAAARVGALFRQTGANGADLLFVLTADGLAPLDATEALLLEAATGAAPKPISAGAVAAAAHSADRSLVGRLPDLTAARPVALPGLAVCLSQHTAEQKVVSAVVLTDPAAAGNGRGGARLRPGSGVVAYGLPVTEARAGSRTGPLYLIADDGRAYRLADGRNDDAAAALGLDGVTPVGVPRWLLATLPAGPELSRRAAAGDPAAARQEG